MSNTKEKQKQHLIDMMRVDEELGLYEEPKKMYSEEQVNELIGLLKQTTEYEVMQSFRDKVDQFKKKWEI